MAALTKKEGVYDELISPLMTQVILLCREHGIAFGAKFDISGPGEEGLCASSQLPDETGKFPKLLLEAPCLSIGHLDIATESDNPGHIGADKAADWLRSKGR